MESIVIEHVEWHLSGVSGLLVAEAVRRLKWHALLGLPSMNSTSLLSFTTDSVSKEVDWLPQQPVSCTVIGLSQETLVPVPARLLCSSEQTSWTSLFSLSPFAFTFQMAIWNNTHLMYIIQIRAKITLYMRMCISKYMMIYTNWDKMIIIPWDISVLPGFEDSVGRKDLENRSIW